MLALSDRVAVIYEGQIVETLAAGSADLNKVGLMMAGRWRAERPA